MFIDYLVEVTHKTIRTSFKIENIAWVAFIILIQ